MKKSLLLLLMSIYSSLCTYAAVGDTFTAKTTEGWDMVFTILDETAKTCQVGYFDSDGDINKMAVDYFTVGSLTIPEKVNGYTVVKIGKHALRIYNLSSVALPNTVTDIDDYAFAGCENLTSFELPASVTAIGEHALERLNNVTTIQVAEGNSVYDSRDNCNAIIETATNKLLYGYKNTIIPASVTEIESNAFYGLYDYTFTIPSTITKIDDLAFASNGNLILQVEHTTPLVISEDVFQNLQNSTLRVPVGCKEAYASATGWNKFGTILEGNEGSTFTAKTTEGWDMVFTILDDNTKTCQVGYLYGSYDKTAVDRDAVEGSVTIPEIVDGYTVVKIGKCALQNIYKMKSVTIPNTITTIDKFAFDGCNNLVSFELPASVTAIGQNVLQGSENVTSLKVAADNPIYDSRDNCNAIIETATNKLLFGCKNSTIPASVTEIGSRAITLSMAYCSFTIPSTITKIDDNAFNCGNLKTIQVGHTTPLVISEKAFSGVTNSTLRVPVGTKDAYAAATGWKDFGKIVEITGELVNVATAGTLSAILSEKEIDPLTITDLTITGQLNGTDFRLLREMAGNDDSGKPTDGVLKKLDLSGADIVAGGEKYLDTDQIISSTEESIPNIGENSFHFATQNNVLGTALFAGCDKLEEIVLPNSIISIGDYVFWYCLNLKALEIPKNVSSIGWRFINGQNDISKLSVAEGNQTFSSPEGSNVLMQGTKMIFGLNSAKVPAGTTIIGSEAFYNCIGLGDVILPEGVTTIEGGAFAWSGLTSIKMPSTLTTIENDAFADCSGLTSFTLPKSVTHYGDGLEGGLGALKECVNLTSIKVEDGNPKYDSRNSCNGIIETATNTLISGCKNTVIPNTVTIIGHQAFRGINLSDFDIPNCITTLGERAFWSSSLTSIKIPSSVTKIGELAFEYCNNLTSVSVEVKTPLVITENTFSNRANATLYVPAGCKSAYEAADYWKEFKEIKELASPLDMFIFTANPDGTTCSVTGFTDKCVGDVTIPESWEGRSVTAIGKDAFRNCNGLTSVTIPSSVTSIGANAFAFCSGLTSITIPSSVTSIDVGDFTAFSGCSKLSSLNVEAGNTKYDSRENCNAIIETGTNTLIVGIQNTIIPNSVTSIGELAFIDCSGLTSMTIPNSVISIGDNAFAYCSGLTSITIPSSVTSIGVGAFSACRNLSSLKVETGNTKYDSRENCNAIIETGTNTLIVGTQNTIIPNSVTSINNYAFMGCSNLTSVNIPNSVTTIGIFAFSECSNLISITISNSVISIGAFAFMDCSNLTSVNIPNSVSSVGECAFIGCNKLTSVTVEAKAPINISQNVFTNKANATLYVPAGCKAAYEAADYWKDFANIVEIVGTTVTAKSYSRAYGEANPTFESEVTSGSVTGTPEITCAATATSNVGSYPIVIAAGTITETNVQYVNGTLTVTKAPLKISAGNYTKKQGEENPTFTPTYDGFKNSETTAVFTTQPTITCAATKDSPAGTYDITVSGAVAGNYEISYVAGTLTVEAVTPPTPMPEPKGTTFDLDTDDSSSKEVKVTFVVKESDGSSTPTVAISDDKDASGSVSIPESVTHNGVEYKVTEISEGAFQNNTSLTEVKIPASITSIGPKAFAGCKNLQEITIYIIVPINIAVISARGYTRAESGDVFEGVDKNTCILYVPEGSVDAYKAAAGWKEFKNILPIKTSTRIYGIESDGEVFDVYSLSGQKVKSKTTSLDGLPRGIYIINGKKVMK